MNNSETRATALEAIHKFTANELAALAGGMTLLPGNLHHLARLESLAMCIVARCARGRRSVTRTSARRLLNETMNAWVGHHDDECDTLATEAFTYHGGTHIFVAPWPASLFALRILSGALAHSKQLPTSFVDAATGLIQGICAISDRLVSHASLVRNMEVPKISRDIDIPPEGSLMALLAAVRIGERELTEIVAQTALRHIDLQSLTATLGEVPLPDPPHASVFLARKPILRLQEELIVIAPHKLVEALVHRLFRMAVEMDVHNLLAEVFHQTLFLATDHNLMGLGLRLSSGALAARSEMNDTLVTHAMYQCDHDKMVHVAIFSDALRVRDGDINGQWSTHEIARELAAARQVIPQALAGAQPPVADWFSLVIIGPVGREYDLSMAALKNNEPYMLTFTSAELETIVLAEGAECSPLLFWRYARALREMETASKVTSWSPLDKYALWRERDRRFPLGAHLLLLNSPFGRALRERAVMQHDYHAIWSRNPGSTIEVMLADGPGQPIYVPRNAGYQRVEIAIERPALVIWVVSSRELDDTRELRMAWFNLGRMLAYWLSEFSGHLASEFAALGSAHDVVVVEFELMDAEMPPPSRGYELTNSSPRMVSVSVHRSFVESYDDTNALEREFAAELVQSVLSLAPSAGAEAVRQCMDDVAPIGVKRMMHRIDTARSPEFIGANHLPLPRHPHPADRFEVRRRMLLKCPLNSGHMEEGEAVTWLNDAVAAIYSELRTLLASFEGRNLLIRLLINNEALVYADAMQEITLASQLACYRSSVTLRDRLLEEGPRHAAASTTTRFLIEHVAAEPPMGHRLASDAEFDSLLAMASELVALGMASDVAHFQLADVCIETEEGDVIVKRGTYEEAAQGTIFSFTQEKIHREQMRVQVPGHKHLHEQELSSTFIERLEAATQEEFGVRLSEVGEVFGEALALAQESSNALVTIRRLDFVHRLTERLTWDSTKANAALDSLTLGPRSRYNRPPSGFQSSDIWPWRFNRGLSYIRRPLVALHAPNGGDELYFTPGHVHRALNNIIGLITSGRLKTQSAALSRVMGELTKKASDSFNDAVAQTLRDRGLIVHTQVEKIGNVKIADKRGNTLGDIDVLCMDPAQCRVVAIECKDFAIARVPHEVRADLETLFISTNGKRCAQEKHIRRLEWLKDNLALVVAWMGGDITNGRWSVDAAFVFSVSLISPMLGRATLPVWTLRDLQVRTAP